MADLPSGGYLRLHGNACALCVTRAVVRPSPPVHINTSGNVTVPTWAPESRAQTLEQLEKDEFDVLVIGGGATGCGVAMDCVSPLCPAIFDHF